MKSYKNLYYLLLVFLFIRCSSNNSNDAIIEDSRHLVKHNPTDRDYATFFHENYYDQLKINNIMLFFTRENNQESPGALGLILNHTQENPISIKQYKFTINGENTFYNPDNLYTIDDFEKKKTIISCQDTLNSKSFEIIKDIINSEQAKIQYIGENDSIIYDIDEQLKTQLSQVIEAYIAMGGKLPQVLK